MHTLMIRGDRLLLGLRFLDYISAFKAEWAGELPGFKGWKPPLRSQDGFIVDPEALRRVLEKAVGIPQRFQAPLVDTYGVMEYYGIVISPKNLIEFLSRNTVLHETTFDAFPFLYETGPWNEEYSDPEVLADNEESGLCIVYRLLRALASGRITEKDMVSPSPEAV